MHLEKDKNYLPDLDELRRLAVKGTKMICLNNPNNPTGALMDEALLKEIVEIARECGAHLMVDEVYRHLTQEDVWSPSAADLYEKGISVSSMSKVFSLAGVRLGWIATKDPSVLAACRSHRDYDLISCGMIDETIAALALSHKDEILSRNRTLIRENLSVLDAWVKSEPHVSYVRPKAGTTSLVSTTIFLWTPMTSAVICIMKQAHSLHRATASKAAFHENRLRCERNPEKRACGCQ